MQGSIRRFEGTKEAPASGATPRRPATLAVTLAALLLAVAAALPTAADAGLHVRRAAAGKLFGFAGVRQTGDPNPLATADLVAKADGNTTRTVIHWQALEPSPGHYDEPEFNRYEQLYSALRARSITPIFVLQFAPAWARAAGAPQACGTWDACHYPPAPSMLGAWQDFVGEVARRFPAAILEIWNEPNYESQWQSGVDPAAYTQLLVAAEQAVHAIHPQQRVITGGLATSAPANGRWLGPGEFLRGAYAANPSLKGHADMINIHVYPGINIGPNSTFGRAFTEVRAARDAAGDSSTPLFVSELGVTTSGPQGASPLAQWQRLGAAATDVLAMPDVAGMLIYTLADRTELSDGDSERGFGLVRVEQGLLGPTIAPKLAYCALRRGAGNQDVDCPPDTRISSRPPAVTPSNEAEFRFTSSDPLVLGYQCSLDGAAFSACGSPVSYHGLASGRHSFSVRSRDLQGRLDPYPAGATFTVDPGDRQLQVAVRPRRARLKPGGRRRKVKVTVTAPGARAPIDGVRICLKAPRKLVRVASGCPRPGAIAPGGGVKAKFRTGLARRAARKRHIRLRFSARAPAAGTARTWATLRPR